MLVQNDNHVSERRFGKRGRCFKRAQLVPDGHAGTFDAAMRNVSRTGALINMSGTEFMPMTFTLNLLNDNISRRCVITWRKPEQMGVVFTR